MFKSEGFSVEIVLPAHINNVKLEKKLIKALPVGTRITLSASDETLNPSNVHSTNSSEG